MVEFPNQNPPPRPKLTGILPQSPFSGFVQARLFGNGLSPAATENRPTLDHRARIICVASGKGGTGKSFFSAGFAQLLSKHGKKVLLLDADFGLSDAHIYLGVKPQADIRSLLNGNGSNDSVLAKSSDNLDYLYGGSGLAELAQLPPLQWAKILKTLSYFEQKYTHIVIDLAAGIGRQVLPYLFSTEELLLITNPDPAALLDAYAVLKILSQKNYTGFIGLIVNRATYQTGEKAAATLKRGTDKFGYPLSIQCLGSISESRGLSIALQQRRTLVDLYPYDPGALDLKKITEKWIKTEAEKSHVNQESSYFLRVKKQGEKL